MARTNNTGVNIISVVTAEIFPVPIEIKSYSAEAWNFDSVENTETEVGLDNIMTAYINVELTGTLGLAPTSDFIRKVLIPLAYAEKASGSKIPFNLTITYPTLEEIHKATGLIFKEALVLPSVANKITARTFAFSYESVDVFPLI